MSTTAEPVTKPAVRKATCIRHPDGNQEMFFCTDCIRVFCTRCRLDDDSGVNHKEHHLIRLDEQLHAKRQRIAQLRVQLEQCGTDLEAAVAAVDEVSREKGRQLVALDNLIDEWSQRFHQRVEEFNSRAKQFIRNKAHEL